MPTRIVIYCDSVLETELESDSAATVWRAAVTYVKAAARLAGETGGLGWYRTANREGFQVGSYRATQLRAHARNAHPGIII